MKPTTIREIVECEYQKWLKGPQHDGWLIIAERVLKAERVRVRRMVKNQKKIGRHPVSQVSETPEWMEGYHQACDDILATLKEGR